MKFYFIFPFLAIPLLAIKDKKLSLFICSAWLALSFLVGPGTKYELVKYVNFFMMGIWVSFFRSFIPNSFSGLKVDALFLVWIMGFLIVSPAIDPVFPLWGPGLFVDIPFLLWAGAGVFLATFSGKLTDIVLGNNVSRWVGNVSYGIYILHYPIIRFMNKVPLPEYGNLIVFLAMTLLVAWFSFTFFEQPIQKFGRNLIAKRGNSVAEKDVVKTTN